MSEKRGRDETPTPPGPRQGVRSRRLLREAVLRARPGDGLVVSFRLPQEACWQRWTARVVGPASSGGGLHVVWAGSEDIVVFPGPEPIAIKTIEIVPPTPSPTPAVPQPSQQDLSGQRAFSELLATQLDSAGGIHKAMVQVIPGFRIPQHLQDEELVLYPHTGLTAPQEHIDLLKTYCATLSPKFNLKVKKDNDLDLRALYFVLSALAADPENLTKPDLQTAYELSFRVLERCFEHSSTFKAPGLRDKLLKAFDIGRLDVKSIIDELCVDRTASLGTTLTVPTPATPSIAQDVDFRGQSKNGYQHRSRHRGRR